VADLGEQLDRVGWETNRWYLWCVDGDALRVEFMMNRWVLKLIGTWLDEGQMSRYETICSLKSSKQIM
jgi:hypothetical protein